MKKITLVFLMIMCFLVLAFSACDNNNTDEGPCLHQNAEVDVVDPTCTSSGSRTVTCRDCGHVDTEELSAKGHTPGDEADCTHDQICTVCNEVLVNALGHSAGDEATCTADQVCLNCNEVLVKAKGHTAGDEATCTTSQICTVCDAVLVEAPGHTSGAEATCTTDQVCTVCNDILVAATGHRSYGATCTEDDVCNTCGEVLHKATGHVPGAEATCTDPQRCTMCYEVLVSENGHVPGPEATCTTHQECLVCGELLAYELGHDIQHHDYQAPTCTESGWYSYESCSRCDYSTKQTIDAKGHYEIYYNAKEPTCEEIGWDTYFTCYDCGYTTYVQKSALGHDEIKHDAKAPTCEEVGWKAYVSCSRCDYTTYEEIAANGHDSVELGDVCTVCGQIKCNDGLSFVSNGDGTCSVGGKWGCSADTFIFIPSVSPDGDKVTTIREEAFVDLTKLESVSIPDTVTCIDDKAFYGCTSLKSVSIPEGVEVIGVYAFCNCTSLKSVSIPESLIKIGYCAFSGCEALDAVYISDVEKWCAIEFDKTFAGYGSEYKSNPLFYAGNLYLDGKLLTDLVIPEGVTAIPDWTFVGCKSIVSVSLPSTLTSIGSDAFDGCAKLIEIQNLSSIELKQGSSNNGYISYFAKNIYTADESKICVEDEYVFYCDDSNHTYYLMSYTGDEVEIVLPESINGKEYEIYRYAFHKLSGLKSVVTSDGVTKIGDYAFNGCSGLTEFKISDGVSYATGSAFNGCSGIVKVIDGLSYVDGCVVDIDYHVESVVFAEGTRKIFDLRSNYITEVVIPEGVTCIGGYAFEGCDHLKSITLPESLKVIGEYAFKDCRVLESVVIPDGVEKIGLGTFNGCSSLASLTIPFVGNQVGEEDTLNLHFSCIFGKDKYNCWSDVPKSLKTVKINGGKIYFKSFEHCYEIENMLIGDGVTYVSSYSSSYMQKLKRNEYGNAYYLGNENNPYLVLVQAKGTNIEYCEIHGETKMIAPGAFAYCQALTEITIPASVVSIGGYAFRECYLLKNVYVSDLAQWCSVEFGNREANPLNCGATLNVNNEPVTSLVIPQSVTEIGKFTFTGCSGLTGVTIHDGVTKIGESAFAGCSGITRVNITDLAKWCEIEFEDRYANPLSVAHNLYLNGSNVTDLVIPDGVTTVKENAFAYFRGMKTLTIPSSVETIGDSAFYNCDSLKNVVISDSVKSIGKWAFAHCLSLESVTFGEGIESVEEGAFYGCDKLSAVHVKDLEKWCSISFGSIESNPLYYAGNLYINGELLTELTIPEGVTEIKFCVFAGYESLTAVHVADLEQWCAITFGSLQSNPLYYAKNLYVDGELVTEVVIPEGVTELKPYAFAGCNMESLVISDSVTSIGYDAFSNCQNLKAVVIPDSVTEMGNGAFNRCESLESVVIGNGVKVISSDTFYQCSKLEELVIGNSVETIGSDSFSDCYKLKSVELPDSVTVIGDSAFYYCSGLENLVFGSNVTHIYDRAFANCSSLKDVMIPDSVTEIGRYAFSSCSGLEAIVIPGGVKSIGEYAFRGCSNLKSVVISEGVEYISSWAFMGCTSLESIVIPVSVINIGGSAFNSCTSFTTVNYAGSEEEWEKIVININNEVLFSATINYNYVPENE